MVGFQPYSRKSLGHRALCVVAGGLLIGLSGCRLGEPSYQVGALPPDLEVVQLPGVSTLSLRLAGPITTFDSVIVSAHSPTQMPQPKQVTLSAAEFDRRQAAGEPILEQLPAAPDMVVRAFLRGPNEQLLASGELPGTIFGRCGNSVIVPVAARVSPPQLLRATDGVKVSDNVVIKGIGIDVATGLPRAMPGIGRVEIELTGPAYGNGQEVAQVASFPAPLVHEYTWRPANASKTYDPARLGAGSEPRPFTLVTKAFDSFGNPVGQTRLDVSIIGTAFVDVGFDPGTNP